MTNQEYIEWLDLKTTELIVKYQTLQDAVDAEVLYSPELVSYLLTNGISVSNTISGIDIGLVKGQYTHGQKFRYLAQYLLEVERAHGRY